MAPIFLIRMAGVPFEPMADLATTATAAAARELIVRQEEFLRARAEVEQLLRRRDHGLSGELFRAWRKAVRSWHNAAGGERAFARVRGLAGNALPSRRAAETRLDEALGQ